MRARLFILLASFGLSLGAEALINGVELKDHPDLVRLSFRERRAVCTGFFVSPTAIVTAAHCLYTPDGQMWGASDVAIDNGQALALPVAQMMPHPAYRRGESSHDVGVIRTGAFAGFRGDFALVESEASSIVSEANIYGAGKIDLEKGEYGRSFGSSSYLRFGDSLYGLGKSRATSSPGEGATVAPNDSGGPIVDRSSGKVMGLATKTSVDLSYGTIFPALSIGVFLGAPENRNFLNSALR